MMELKLYKTFRFMGVLRVPGVTRYIGGPDLAEVLGVLYILRLPKILSVPRILGVMWILGVIWVPGIPDVLGVLRILSTRTGYHFTQCQKQQIWFFFIVILFA